MQQPDRNTTGLQDAADRRSQRAGERARRAIRRLDRAGEPVSFQSVAREASVSRQFLYSHDQLRGEIERLRAAHLEAAEAIPPAQRASEASLKAPAAAACCDRSRAPGVPATAAAAWTY